MEVLVGTEDGTGRGPGGEVITNTLIVVYRSKMGGAMKKWGNFSCGSFEVAGVVD